MNENEPGAVICEIIHDAALAPSGHNTQPWKFSASDTVIRIYPDFSRRLEAVDPNDRELFISLGCALENLAIAATHAGYTSRVSCFLEGEPDCIRVELEPGAPGREDLFAGLPERQCTRSEYDGRAIPVADLTKLKESCRAPGVSCHCVSATSGFDAIIALVREADRRQYGDRRFVSELVGWLRFTKAEAARTGDGLFSGCAGNPNVPRWLGERIVRLSGYRGQASGDERKLRSSSAVVLLATEADDRQAWINSGRAAERFALTATTLGIKMAFVNQPVEIAELRPELRKCFDSREAWPQLLIRIGYGPSMPRSQRRALEQVLVTSA